MVQCRWIIVRGVLLTRCLVVVTYLIHTWLIFDTYGAILLDRCTNKCLMCFLTRWLVVVTYLIHMVQYYWMNILGVFLQDAWLWPQRLPPGTNQHQTPGHSFGIIFALLLFCFVIVLFVIFLFVIVLLQGFEMVAPNTWIQFWRQWTKAHFLRDCLRNHFNSKNFLLFLYSFKTNQMLLAYLINQYLINIW